MKLIFNDLPIGAQLLILAIFFAILIVILTFAHSFIQKTVRLTNSYKQVQIQKWSEENKVVNKKYLDGAKKIFKYITIPFVMLSAWIFVSLVFSIMDIVYSARELSINDSLDTSVLYTLIIACSCIIITLMFIFHIVMYSIQYAKFVKLLKQIKNSKIQWKENAKLFTKAYDNNGSSTEFELKKIGANSDFNKFMNNGVIGLAINGVRELFAPKLWKWNKETYSDITYFVFNFEDIEEFLVNENDSYVRAWKELNQK
ncbi:hypothetical protein NPA13_02285 [Mycoplasma sp. 2045]|uniref:hypothetical protein n=1 Tax=Mycoplasma sp. 2045 TaxID=2967301 RepID=UPI00211CC65B|nr:hypothetical protein [Mycoplasma sp. 2045]UUM20266.1 hypothetical protein NPA13_02285 [Mycoplasma sp. 2045]